MRVCEGASGTDYHALMTEALHRLLLERGVLEPADVDRLIAQLSAPRREWGARIIARAWVDDGFRARLLANGRAAAAEVGFAIKEAQLVVLENTPDLHNLVVCTLCSCYPRSLLGQPPWWYVSKAYRARAVREPRAVLAELGYALPDGMRVRVHDSNADMRYLVLPMRPAGTEGWDEPRLADCIPREAMVGAAPARLPA
jgi:nitrile hydratase